MPAPPRKLKDQVEDDLDHYASQRWPQLEEVTIRWRGSYGYVEGLRHRRRWHPAVPDRLPRLARRLGIRDLPGQHRDIPGIVPHGGSTTGTPQEALDCACGLYLADPSAWT
jgi:hypothetical protein